VATTKKISKVVTHEMGQTNKRRVSASGGQKSESRETKITESRTATRPKITTKRVRGQKYSKMKARTAETQLIDGEEMWDATA